MYVGREQLNQIRIYKWPWDWGATKYFPKKKVKSYIIQYHKLIITVHTAVADKKRSKELSSYVIVHIWLLVCVCMSQVVVKLYPKRTKKKTCS